MPSARAKDVYGLAQAKNGPSSSLHSKRVNSRSSEEKLKLGVLSAVVAAGP